MEISQLIATGLSEQQAQAYSLLLEGGDITPPQAAKKLNVSRTNAYKILDKLVEIGIAQKNDSNKKIVYSPSHPSSLNDYVYQMRAEATAREEALNSVMSSMLSKYYEHTDKPGVEVHSGKQNVIAAFRKQIGQKDDIYFVHSKSDVSQMGFDTMHEIRTAPSRHGAKRFGIMSQPSGENPHINYASHKRTNLQITWMRRGLYSSPVEWSATNSNVLIVLYTDEPQAILIHDKIVAASFKQMWHMLSLMLSEQETHTKLAE